jgi:Tfp pilus assembly PilM family ATPase
MELRGSLPPDRDFSLLKMAKGPTSAIGIDLGRRLAKAVHLRRSAQGVELAGWAALPMANGETLGNDLGGLLRALVKSVGGGAKECGIALSSGAMLLRLLEQPETQVDLLREAVRLNGMSLFNQDCRGYVLDCVRIGEGLMQAPVAAGQVLKRKYLVGGIPRAEVEGVAQACEQAAVSVKCLQLPPVCCVNAFENAFPAVFAGEPFFLLDLGHASFTLLAGVRRELVVVRSLEGGGKGLLGELSGGGIVSEAEVVRGMETGSPVLLERARGAVHGLVRQIGSTVAFLEARSEGELARIHVSGGGARWGAFLKLLSEEVQVDCVNWNPLGEGVGWPAGAPEGLHAACGAALQVMELPART